MTDSTLSPEPDARHAVTIRKRPAGHAGKRPCDRPPDQARRRVARGAAAARTIWRADRQRRARRAASQQRFTTAPKAARSLSTTAPSTFPATRSPRANQASGGGPRRLQALRARRQRNLADGQSVKVNTRALHGDLWRRTSRERRDDVRRDRGCRGRAARRVPTARADPQTPPG